MNLGQAIRELRKERKIKGKDLCASCGISTTALYNIEHNLTFPTKPTIEALAKALGVSVSIIMLYSITEEDVPEERREAFRYLIGPIKEFLKK